MRTRLLSLSSLLIVLLIACDDAPTAPPQVELGSGIGAFVPIEDGQDLRIVQGIQGGYHIVGAVRATGIEPWGASLELGLFQGDSQIGGAHYLDDFTRRDDALLFTGITVFLWADHPPESVEGTPTRMTLEVTDAEGRVAHDELRFVPVCCDYLL